MAITPNTTVRIPEPLKREVEAFGRERRWTFGETARFALEQLVGYQPRQGNGRQLAGSDYRQVPRS